MTVLFRGENTHMPVKRTTKIGPSNLLLRRRNLWLRRLAEPSAAEQPGEDETTRRTRVEGILFLAKEPLSSGKIAQLADVRDGREVRAIIAELNKQYDKRGQSFRIEQIAGGFRYLSKQAYSCWIRRLESSPAPIRFSRPVIETLSVIAYRQPVMRAEVEAVRGVGCGEVIRQLMDRGFVRISGRSEDLGRPFLYSTSKQFLATFGLNNLSELPEIYLPEAVEQDLEAVDIEPEAEEEQEAEGLPEVDSTDADNQEGELVELDEGETLADDELDESADEMAA